VLLAALPEEEALQRLQRMVRQRLTPKTITEIPALMEELARVRAQGYALNDEELELGVRSIAVPIRNAAGQTLASVSLATAASRRTTDNMIDTLLPELESVRRMLGSLI
jgi:IclR family pca regulon transcriptional regulator